jgi:hypothetical protein
MPPKFREETSKNAARTPRNRVSHPATWLASYLCDAALVCSPLKGSPAAGSQPSDDTRIAGSDLLSVASAFQPTLSPSLQIARQAAIDTRSRLACSGHFRSFRPHRLRPTTGKARCPTTCGPCGRQAIPGRPIATYSGPDVLDGINAFLGLLQTWKLSPARGWRILTGLGYRAGSLTFDQLARVQHLVAIDAGMRTIKCDAVGDWMVAGNVVNQR